MTVTIHLPSDIEADLVAQARDHGLELPQYVESLLRGQISPRAGSALSPRERAAAGGWPARGPFPPGAGSALSPRERAAAWRESTRAPPHTQPLSDDAISRESIYGDDGR